MLLLYLALFFYSVNFMQKSCKDLVKMAAFMQLQKAKGLQTELNIVQNSFFGI